MSDKIIECEQKIIHLMLRYKSVIEEMIDDGLGVELFDDVHKTIVDHIYKVYLGSDNRRLMKRETYRQILAESGFKDILREMEIYAKCSLKASAQEDEIEYLKKRLIENFVSRQSNRHVKQFTEDVKKKGYMQASRNLADNLEAALSLVETRRSTFTSLDAMESEYFETIESERANPHSRVRTGYEEIDESICVGLRPMHLTLFVADVGGHKTNMMLNVALSIYERGHSVLFIPLEMTRIDLMNRVLANKANIHYSKIANPELLSDEEMNRMRECTIWNPENQARFCILDADERTSVSSLQREIEKRAFAFKPDVVIIDYIGIVQPDVRFGQRNDIEIGEILKSLRFLGKKYEFHIVSAAQMNRQAIKSLREGKESALDSTSIHGSHQYSADSDTIFALQKYKDEPNRLSITAIKARHGPMGIKRELNVDPAHCRITSTSNTQGLSDYDGGLLDDNLNEPVSDIASALNSDVSLDFETWDDIADVKPEVNQDDEFEGLGL